MTSIHRLRLPRPSELASLVLAAFVRDKDYLPRSRKLPPHGMIAVHTNSILASASNKLVTSNSAIAG